MFIINERSPPLPRSVTVATSVQYDLRFCLNGACTTDRKLFNLSDTHNYELPDLQQGPQGHPVCTDCGRTIWNDPKIAGAAIVPMDGGIVMVQRAIEPAIGKWSFPSGYVNRGEKLERAVEREVLEECGLEVVVGDIVGLYSEEGNPIVLAVYEARVIGGKMESADHETLDVQIFNVDELPELAFEHDRGIVVDWLKSQEKLR